MHHGMERKGVVRGGMVMERFAPNLMVERLL